MSKFSEYFVRTLREDDMEYEEFDDAEDDIEDNIEDDIEDEKAYNLKEAFEGFFSLLSKRCKEGAIVNEEEPREINGKRIIKVYNDDFDDDYKHDLNCVFVKEEDPAKEIDSGIHDESKIINLNEYRNRKK